VFQTIPFFIVRWLAKGVETGTMQAVGEMQLFD